MCVVCVIVHPFKRSHFLPLLEKVVMNDNRVATYRAMNTFVSINDGITTRRHSREYGKTMSFFSITQVTNRMDAATLGISIKLKTNSNLWLSGCINVS